LQCFQLIRRKKNELALLEFIALDNVVAVNNDTVGSSMSSAPLRRQDFSGSELANVARLRQRLTILTP
jgi:hypothetical protein